MKYFSQKLLGESSALDRVGRFLAALPDFMVRFFNISIQFFVSSINIH